MLQRTRQFVKKQGAWVAMLLFAVHLLPQELIHELFPHNDTEHEITAVSKAGTTIGHAHVHCTFEQLEGESCAAHEFIFRPVIAAHSYAHAALVVSPVFLSEPSFLFLRGPPQLIG
ncbi:MAG: hypothetical protein IM638_02425 [Bacteroidetes bacterium]|nr:hypothetical protein [Bacteroidota bacterium]